MRKEQEYLTIRMNKIKEEYGFSGKLIFDSTTDYYLIDINAKELDITDDIIKFFYDLRRKFHSEFPCFILLINWIGRDYAIEGELIYDN